MTVSDAPTPPTAPGGMEIVSITPEPTDTERAAIVAAIEALRSQLWPRRGAASMPSPSPRWRYAGRPWQRKPNYGGWK